MSKDTDQDKVKTKLPQLDDNSVEEIPAGDLEGIAGGCTNGSVCLNVTMDK